MVSLKAERRVFLWRLRPEVTPAGAQEAGKGTSLDEIISILEAEQTAGKARVYLKGGSRILEAEDAAVDQKNQLFIAEIKRDDKRKVVTLLFSRGDPEASDPAFINPVTNNVRVERPNETETSGWSAHLTISTAKEVTGHRACFEQISHVSSAVVLGALDHIISRALASNRTYRFCQSKTVNGKPAIVWHDYRPRIAISRVPSERLLDDLESGSLTGLTLKKSQTYYSGVGTKDIIKSQEERVVIHLHKNPRQVVEAFLKPLLQKAKQEKFEAVTFHVDDLPGKQTSAPTLSLGDHDALEQLYVRAKRLINFDSILENGYSSVCVEIEDKMVALIADSAEW